MFFFLFLHFTGHMYHDYRCQESNTKLWKCIVSASEWNVNNSSIQKFTPLSKSYCFLGFCFLKFEHTHLFFTLSLSLSNTFYMNTNKYFEPQHFRGQWNVNGMRLTSLQKCSRIIRKRNVMSKARASASNENTGQGTIVNNKNKWNVHINVVCVCVFCLNAYTTLQAKKKRNIVTNSFKRLFWFETNFMVAVCIKR